MKIDLKSDYLNPKKAPDLLYGLFYEDINHAADGGMNAELIANNSFEFEYINYNESGEPVDLRFDKLRYWTVEGCEFAVKTGRGMSVTNPSFLSLDISGMAKLINCGYPYENDLYGMGIEPDAYNFSVYMRGAPCKVSVYLESENGAVSDTLVFRTSGDREFVKYGGRFNAIKDCTARLIIIIEGNGTVEADYFSLIGENDAFGDSNLWRYGRLKRRFVEVLRGCSPRFLRFPGGCIVEGDVDFGNMYMWKDTVGPLEERRQNANTWQYMQSYAIGFYEYFLLCEELKAEPLPILPCGLLCQIRCGFRHEGDRSYTIGTPEFDEKVVDNVAHLLYFALGDVNSADPNERYWANVRRQSGHAKPFVLSMLGLGNENWGKVYFDNLNAALAALKIYPYAGQTVDLLRKFGVTIVVAAGVDIRPQDTNASSKYINDTYSGVLIDEHVYNTEQWFLDNSHRYDVYDRKHNKIFMGEYGMHTKSDGRGALGGDSDMRAALAEAAFLTGCERNGDVVSMAAYAPLFAKTHGYKWTPNLIWFNNKQIMRTPSYFVQSMFAGNFGTEIIPIDSTASTDIRGGLLIGTQSAEVLFKRITVTEGDKIIYSHDFATGAGDWQLYPRCEDGEFTQDGLVLFGNKFNAYYLDKQFGDCRVSIDVKRLGGNGGIILGMGVCGVRESDGADFDMHSLRLDYGAWGNKPVFEKRYKYMRTAHEVLDDADVVFPIDGLSLELCGGELIAQKLCDGKAVTLFSKKVWRTHGELFFSATKGGGEYYIKAVNTGNAADCVELEFPASLSKAEITVLCAQPDEKNEINGRVGVTERVKPVTETSAIAGDRAAFGLPPHSVTIIKLSE